jgi:hypothetical protein
MPNACWKPSGAGRRLEDRHREVAAGRSAAAPQFARASEYDRSRNVIEPFRAAKACPSQRRTHDDAVGAHGDAPQERVMVRAHGDASKGDGNSVSAVEKILYLGAALGCFGMALFGRNLFWSRSKDRSKPGPEAPREPRPSRLPWWLGRVLFLAGGLWILYEAFAR